MQKNYCDLFFIGVLLISSSVAAQDKRVPANDAHLRYMGRMEAPAGNAAVLSWTASNVTFYFTGSFVKGVLDDELGKNHYNVIVDDTVAHTLHLDKGEKEYVLAGGLGAGDHKLVLFKRTEASMGKTIIRNFLLEDTARLLPLPPAPERKIEFYGNSITCGYGNEDTVGKGTNNAPEFENAYLSYAAFTARYFNADYRCISKSGIGVTVSWFPLIMPEMYDRLYVDDSARKWDFSKYTPDIVVVNLFQNDSWLVHMPADPEFKRRFGTVAPAPGSLVHAYASFIQKILEKYPSSRIICALGNMDATKPGSPWPGYVQKAVDSLNNKNVYTCFFPFKNTKGHPLVPEQKAMSAILVSFIEKNIKW